MSTRLSLLALGAVALVSLSACDSGDAIDPPTPADVAGLYDIAEFRFTPEATAFPPINVIDTLVAGDTYLELLDGGQLTLRFRRQGGTTRFVPGTFDVRRKEIRLAFASGSDATLERLLLPQTLTFTRGDALTASTDLTVNLEAYDPVGYAGGSFRSVRGTLTLRLVPRAGS